MFFNAKITKKYPYFHAYIRKYLIYKRKRAWARSHFLYYYRKYNTVIFDCSGYLSFMKFHYFFSDA